MAGATFSLRRSDIGLAHSVPEDGYTLRMADNGNEITRLLEAWSQGSAAALDQLIPLVFDDLHRMARYFFQRESKTHTMQPTALVNEVYFRLRGQRQVAWNNRAEFFHFAADVMRHFLVDYARRRNAEKRGGSAFEVPIDSALELLKQTGIDVVDLHRALEELAEIDPRQGEIVKLRFFIGLRVEEVAEVLDISEATIKREWRTAKLWLRRRLGEALDESDD